ncbi:MAG: SOS response-associated peptidase family protein [Verrucomicrobiales bacterium]|nr:SOS response-associated peptidase family protein [Verrucomicrobiales bacterium]
MPEKPFGIRKTDPGLVVSPRDNLPVAEIRHRGFARHYNPAVNNARIDKLDGQSSLPWRKMQRCLIPLSTWYEWSGPPGAKQTFAFQSQHRDELLWATGLRENGDSGPTYSMITREASPTLAFIHPRIPALLEPAAFDAFLKAKIPAIFSTLRSRICPSFDASIPFIISPVIRGLRPWKCCPAFSGFIAAPTRSSAKC